MRKIQLFIFLLLVVASVTAEAQDRLKEFSRSADAQWKAARSAAESLATLSHIPVRAVQAGGRVIELQRFEHGMPRYYATENINAARTISTDKVWPTGGLGYLDRKSVV